MKTTMRLAILGGIVLYATVIPAGAQVPGVGAPNAAVAPAHPYTPPACVPGVPFADITCTTPFDPWIEQFGADGITAGCGGGDFCPDGNVTRSQMAVFVEKAMHGTAYWSPGDTGSANTAAGESALVNNSPNAWYNTAIGFQALFTQSFTYGGTSYYPANTAVGAFALYNNQPAEGTGGNLGIVNTAVGANSLFDNTNGLANTGVGVGSGDTNATGSWNTFLGASTGVSTDGLVDVTAVGSNAVVDASYHVRVGDDQITQIGGQVAWSNLSDERAKEDIQDLDLGLDFVMSLRPVSFQLIKGNGRTDMGFIAQDIETLLGDGYNVLGIGQDKDRTLSLRYTDFIAPMVKAIQQQQAEIQARDHRIQQLESDVAALKTQMQALLAEHARGGAATRK